jgi:hypothetical protein
MELESCLNHSILWLIIIFYYKKFNDVHFEINKNILFFLSKKSFVDVFAPLNWQKSATRRNIN